jgi:hypothetical protein
VYAALEPIPVHAPATDLEVVVEKLGSLRIRFRAPKDGPPLPDRVFVWERREGGGSGTGHALADGVLRLAGFRGERVTLEVLFDSFVPFRREVRVALGEEADLGSWPLDPGVTLEGRVVDPEGRPVAGAHLWCGEDLTPWREAVSRGDGSFALPHVGVGEAEVGAGAEGFLPAKAKVRAGPGAEPAALVLRRGALVTGRLTDREGGPLEDHWIQFRRPPAEPGDEKGEFLDETGTEEDGGFEIRLPSGPCRILFVTEDRVRVLAELELEEGGQTEVTLVLPD